MFNVFLADQLLLTLPKTQEGLFLAVCDSQKITYQHTESGDYLLYPPLAGKSFVLSPHEHLDKKAEQFLKNITDTLTAQGALVLYSPPGSLHNDIMEILKVDLVIQLASQNKEAINSKIRFFYSLKKKKESLKIIASIIKLLAQQDNLKFKVAKTLDILNNPSLYKLYAANIPTIRLQLDFIDAADLKKLEDALIKGILDLYGEKQDQMHIERATSLVESLILRDIKKKDADEEEFLKTPLSLEKETEFLRGEELLNISNKENISIAGQNLPNDELSSSNAREIPAPISTPLLQELKEPNKIKAKENTVRKTPLKKEKTKAQPKRNFTLFPPEDGPIFQFVHTEKNCSPYQTKNTHTVTPKSGHCFNIEIPTKPWENLDYNTTLTLKQDFYGHVPETTSEESQNYCAIANLKNLAKSIKSYDNA